MKLEYKHSTHMDDMLLVVLIVTKGHQHPKSLLGDCISDHQHHLLLLHTEVVLSTLALQLLKGGPPILITR